MKKPPNWFDLKKYESASQLTSIEWFNNLYRRHLVFILAEEFGLYNSITNSNAKEGLQLMVDEIIDEPIVLGDGGNWDVPCQVEPLAIKDIEVLLFHLRTINSGAYSLLLERLNSNKTYRIKGGGQDRFWRVSDRGYFSVNLNATDGEIIRDFKTRLSECRDNAKSESLGYDFKQKDFEDWDEFRVLPYLDLMMWGKFSGGNFTQHVIADWIFPDEFETNTTDRVRRITKKKADFLMQESTLAALRLFAKDCHL